MNFLEARKKAGLRLKTAGIEQWALEAGILLAAASSASKEYVLAHGERELKPAESRRFFNYVRRRELREPAAYILGRKEFYGNNFETRRGVLIPRPETETIIDTVLKTNSSHLVTRYSPLIIDIGAGCGAIAVTLAKLLPKARVYASDVSEGALRLARKNARLHKVQITFRKGSLLEPWKKLLAANLKNEKNGKPVIITANLPYLPASDWKELQPEIRLYEPKSAFIAGKDGLYWYRKLVKSIRMTNYTSRVILTAECDPRNCGKLARLARKTFPKSKTKIIKDLSGLPRVVIIT